VPGDTFTARAARWLAGTDTAGLLYGAIVSASVLAAISVHATGAQFVAFATGIVLVIYWLAHVYIRTLSGQLGGDQRHFLHRVRRAAGHETGVLKGGLPALVVYVVAHTAGMSIANAAASAVYFSVVLLAAVGYLSAHQAGLRGRELLWETAGAASFGVLIVIGKTFLH
jgi:hypothetical protein